MSRYKRKTLLALLLALATMLTACGRRDDNSNVIPESTGGKDLVRAEAADEVRLRLHVAANEGQNRHAVQRPYVARRVEVKHREMDVLRI